MTTTTARTVAALTLAALGFVTGCSAGPGHAETAESVETTRAVEHARGVTEVTENPTRVVTLEPVELDTSVALGVVPVGTTVLSAASGVPEYLGAEAGAATSVGITVEPDLEAIAALQPDLILGTETRHSSFYDRLAAIAPTVFMASQSDPWKDNVRLVGRALGREDDAEALLTEYDDRCAEVGRTHDTQGRTAQLIRPRNDLLTLYGPLSFAGSTLECAGFTTPPREEWSSEISVDLSPERASDGRADLVLVTSGDPEDPSTLPASIAVNDAVFPEPHLVDQSYWITGVGPMGGLTVLDDLERILGGDA